jgi:hypothetical protein
MKLASILFVLVIVSGLATLGVLFAGPDTHPEYVPTERVLYPSLRVVH